MNCAQSSPAWCWADFSAQGVDSSAEGRSVNRMQPGCRGPCREPGPPWGIHHWTACFMIYEATSELRASAQVCVLSLSTPQTVFFIACNVLLNCVPSCPFESGVACGFLLCTGQRSPGERAAFLPAESMGLTVWHWENWQESNPIP